MSASPWVVTARHAVHVRSCHRVTAVTSSAVRWLPSTALKADRACMTCLTGRLPDADEERDALTTPTTEEHR